MAGDIRSKKPKVLGARVAGLRLTPEERFVMARIDGRLSVDELASVTGLEGDRLEKIVSKLAFDGAVDLGEEPRFAAAAAAFAPAEGETTSMAELAAALGMDPSSFGGGKTAPVEMPPPTPRKVIVRPKIRPKADPSAVGLATAPAPAAEEAAPPVPAAHDSERDLPDVQSALDLAALEAFGDETPPDAEPASPGDPPRRAAPRAQQAKNRAAVDEAPPQLDELEEVHDELEEVHDELEEVHDELEEVHDEEDQLIELDDEGNPVSRSEQNARDRASDREQKEEDEVSRAVAERNYRQVFEKSWHPLPVDQRIAGARTAHGPDLLALCFDPDPRVIAAILENSTVGLDHVRLIAFYHRTGTGLEIVARRQDWLRDILVERRLLRNPMIGDIVLSRVMGPKRLFQTYKIAIDREIPELTRTKVRGYIRQKWQNATSEERADLLLRTEARCLIIMTGCTFDAKTTAILCGRPINSVMFVQSIAKFPASPPALLAHLMKQNFVRKNPPLKKMLLAHPNMPGDVKRNI